MTRRDDVLNRAAETLKEPVQIDPSFDDRVMARIAELSPAAPSRLGSAMRWLRRRRTIAVSPLGGLATAAALGAVVFLGMRMLGTNDTAPDATAALAVATDTPVIQFVLVAPTAKTVSLVGDFNDWDVAATPLVQNDGRGVWSVTVPLEPGRYRYSFLVDGTTWLEDPRAAPALGDEFGRPNSVITIGGA